MRLELLHEIFFMHECTLWVTWQVSLPVLSNNGQYLHLVMVQTFHLVLSLYRMVAEGVVIGSLLEVPCTTLEDEDEVMLWSDVFIWPDDGTRKSLMLFCMRVLVKVGF